MFTLTPVSIGISDYLYSEEILTEKTNSTKLTAYLDAEKLATPVWHGKALAEFDLAAGQEVKKEKLDAFLSIISSIDRSISKVPFKRAKQPKTPKQVRRLDKKEKQKCALELGFAAPKPLSSLVALVGSMKKQELLDGFHEAVTFALDEIEKRGVYARRGKSGLKHEKATGLVYAIFTHLTSRSVDPHLHAHVVTITKNMPRFDGTFGNVEERYLYLIQKEIRHIFNARLAENLRALGYDTRYKDGSFDIVGIEETLNDHWSKRRQQIVAEKKAKNLSGPQAGNIAARNTRAKKQVHQLEDLFEKWENEALEIGIDLNEIQQLHLRGIGLHISDENLLDFPEFTTEYLSTKLVENKSIFTQQEAYAFAAELALKSGQSVTIALNAVDELLSSNLIVELQSSSRYTREFTTERILKLEYQLIRSAQALHEQSFTSDFDLNLITKIEQVNKITLRDEQRSAVVEAISNTKLSLINGSAGSGKSTIMRIVKDLYQLKNCRVYGGAIAKAAAKNLENAAGIPSTTIAKILLEFEVGKSYLRFGDVLIIDEAGQVGLHDSLALFKYAKSIGFKIIMVGEDKQLDAIQHGGVLRCLSKPEIIGSSRIETVVRQQEEWDRRAVMAFRDGFAEQGLKVFQTHGRLSIVDTQIQAIEKMVADWSHYALSEVGGEPLVIARTWNDVNLLNRQLRQVLINQGKLGTENFSLEGRVGNRTLAFSISIGEKLRFTRNDNIKGYTNGDVAEVTQIELKDGNILGLALKRSDGKILCVNIGEYSDHNGRPFFVPAYAQTIYSSQGQTVEGKVFVLNDSRMERSNAYVALSRHRSDCHLYVAKDQIQGDLTLNENDVIDLLAQQYSEDRYNKLAIERLIGSRSINDLLSHRAVTLKEQELDIA